MFGIEEDVEEFYATRTDRIVFLFGDTNGQARLVSLRTDDDVCYRFYFRSERLARVVRERPADDVRDFSVVEWRGGEGDHGHLNHRLQECVPTVFLCHCENLFHRRRVSTSAEGRPWVVMPVWSQVMVLFRWRVVPPYLW